MLAFEVIKRDIPKKDYWFKKMWYINLPDAKDGHAILNYNEGRFSLETYSKGLFCLIMVGIKKYYKLLRRLNNSIFKQS